jgi:hypothetical protein
VEELHGLGRRELEKCSEGAGVFWCFPTVRKKVEKEKKKTEGCNRRKKEREKGKRRSTCDKI